MDQENDVRAEQNAEILPEFEAGNIGYHSTWMSPTELTFEDKPTEDGDVSYFEYGEHKLLGDNANKRSISVQNIQEQISYLKLPGGSSLSYGSISALAGDYYGTFDPISDGSSPDKRRMRFEAAFNTLARSTPGETIKISNLIQKESEAVSNAIKNGRQPSEGYSTLGITHSWALNNATKGRVGIPTYIQLAEINWDHFGEDARLVYNTGHRVAIDYALSHSKDEDALRHALALNAFADHFLQDCFSAGHLRVPRRALSGEKLINLCAKYMHDEDSAIGLQVKNKKGDSWTAYGDKYLQDDVNKKNRELCEWAVVTSILEVWKAWKTGKNIEDKDFEVWDYAPTLESAASGNQPLAPLFFHRTSTMANVRRRFDVSDRRTWKFLERKNWAPSGTVAAIMYSGKWGYPMSLD